MASDRRGPKPWFGCDTWSEPWRAYCEAWGHAFKRVSPRLKGMIYDTRGKAAYDALLHNIELVKADYRGEIEDRTELARRLR